MRGEPRSLDDTRARVALFQDDFAAGRHFRYAAWRRGDGALVGEVMLLGRGGPGILEIGYWLAGDQVRRGYAIEAVRALVEAARALPHVTTLVFQCDVRNLPSNAVPDKLGARVARVVSVDDPDGSVQLNVWELALGP